MTFTKTNVVAAGAAMVFMAALLPAVTSAQTTTTSTTTTTTSSSSVTTTVTASTTQATMLAKIQTLMKLIADLQKQLNEARGSLADAIKEGLVEGSQDEDIKKIQSLLASDKEIYPEGKVTGYYGPLTREAIKRFQVRYDLEATGRLDEQTRNLMKELFKERQGEMIPPGLLKSAEAKKRVMDRLQSKWGEDCDLTLPGRGNRCEKPWKDDKGKDKDKDKNADDEDEDENEDDDDDNATSTITRDDARKALADAQKSITELSEDIVDAEDSNATSTKNAVEEAEDILEDVKENLAKAKKDYSDGKYADAYEIAEEIEEEVEEAREDLEEAVEEEN